MALVWRHQGGCRDTAAGSIGCTFGELKFPLWALARAEGGALKGACLLAILYDSKRLDQSKIALCVLYGS